MCYEKKSFETDDCQVAENRPSIRHVQSRSADLKQQFQVSTLKKNLTLGTLPENTFLKKWSTPLKYTLIRELQQLSFKKAEKVFNPKQTKREWKQSVQPQSCFLGWHQQYMYMWQFMSSHIRNNSAISMPNITHFLHFISHYKLDLIVHKIFSMALGVVCFFFLSVKSVI